MDLLYPVGNVRLMYRPVAAFALCASAVAAHAESTPVPGRILNEMVAGSTVVIDAPMGFKLPIRHGDDGTITGEAGGLAFYLGTATDTGRWWVADDRLCYKWSKWFKSEARCMRVRRDGARIEWEKEDGDKGTGTLTMRANPSPSKHPADVAAAQRPPIRLINAQANPAPQSTATDDADTGTAKPRAFVEANGTRSAPARTTPALQPAAQPKPALARPAAAAVANAAPPAQNIQLAQASISAGVPVPLAAPTAPRLGPPSSPPYRVGGPPLPQSTYKVVSVAANDVLNIRTGPSKEHPSIGTIDPEARGVRLVGTCQGDWCPVRHLGVVGWVNSYYLEPSLGYVGPSIPRIPAER